MEKIKELIVDNINEPVVKFCKNCGVNRTTIVGILNGNYNRNLNLLTIKKICNYFKVDFRNYI